MRIYTIIAVSLVFTLLILTSCDEPDSYSAITDSNRQELQEWAGILARYWVIQPNDSLCTEKPEEDDLRELIQLCESNPESWAYLYNCIADTIAVLEPPLPACQQPDNPE